MKTKIELQISIKDAQHALSSAKEALEAFNDLAENNVFATMEEAERSVENVLRDRAHADCEGSHNCGLDQYEQQFMVAGIKYVGRIDVDYNRHDKTYYYIEECRFTVKTLEIAA